MLANPPSCANAVPFAALAPPLRASRATVPHCRSRSSPPKIEGHAQYHPYHVHGAARTTSIAQRNLHVQPDEHSRPASSNALAAEQPVPIENVARSIDFVSASAEAQQHEVKCRAGVEPQSTNSVPPNSVNADNAPMLTDNRDNASQAVSLSAIDAACAISLALPTAPQVATAATAVSMQVDDSTGNGAAHNADIVPAPQIILPSFPQLEIVADVQPMQVDSVNGGPSAADACPRFVCPFSACNGKSWGSKYQLLTHVENAHLAADQQVSGVWLRNMSRAVCPKCKLLVPCAGKCRNGTCQWSASAKPPVHVPVPSAVPASEVTRAQALYDCLPTLRHVPKGCIDDVLVLTSDLIRKTVEHRDQNSMLDFLLMPTTVLAPLVRGGKKHADSNGKLVAQRASRWIADPTPAASSAPIKRPTRPSAATGTECIADHEIDESLRRSVITAVQESALSKGCKMLQSESAANDADLHNKLQPLFPASSVPITLDNDFAGTGNADFTEAFVEKMIRSFPAGSGAGPSGLRPSHLKDMLRSRKKSVLLVALADFVSCLANGGFPPDVMELLTASKLFAVRKKDGGPRPIASGDTICRLAAKCLLHTYVADCVAYLSPLQVGVGVKNATELVIHHLQQWYDSRAPDEVFLQVDISNAFNTVDRTHMLSEIRTHAPAFYHYAAACYGRPSRMCGNGFTIWSEAGVQQGDVCGPLFFSLAIHPVVKAAEEGEADWNCFYLDDGNSHGNPQAVASTYQTLCDGFSSIGLQINAQKCCIFGTPNSTWPEILLHLPHKDISAGVVVLGGPIGSHSFVQEHIGKVTDRMTNFFGKLRGLKDVHSQMLIMRACTGACQINHLLRVLPFEDGASLASDVSHKLRKELDFYMECDTTDAQFDLATLPARCGGLGLRNPVNDHSPALLASWLSFFEVDTSATAKNLRDCDSLQRSFSHLRTTYGTAPTDLLRLSERAADDHPLKDNIPPDLCKQKWWSKNTLEPRCDHFDNTAPQRLVVLRRSHASSVVDPLGLFRCADLQRHIAPSPWQKYLRYRVGATLTKLSHISCPGCAAPMDILGDHALCCKSLGVYGRHNALRNAVVSLACEAGCHVYPEAPLPSTFERPADALIEGLDPDGPVAVDVAITHMLQPSTSLAAASDETSIAHVEIRKKSHYGSLCEANGWRFLPCVASTAGTWGDGAKKLMSRLIRKRALVLGTSFADEARYVWEYVNSSILYSVSRQLERAFHCENNSDDCE